MSTDIRRWIKEEKQLVRLLYRKGFLSRKVNDLYWAEYHFTGKKIKYKGCKFSHTLYFPEVHYCTVDYWGEADEHSIVDELFQTLWWDHAETSNWDNTSGEWPTSSFKIVSRRKLIKYLRKLPTKISDNKINKILNKINFDY
jgi:hypothetical protein